METTQISNKRMDKLVFKQWKIKNNNKKNPNTASFHLYKIFKYLKTYIYRYNINIILYIYILWIKSGKGTLLT